MKSGVRKSGWPMPRLMMSRPWAASALARASTAKAFSSPIRSKAAIVFSMAFPRRFLTLFAAAAAAPSTAFAGPTDLDLGELHDFEDNGDRDADQQKPVERHHRSD